MMEYQFEQTTSSVESEYKSPVRKMAEIITLNGSACKPSDKLSRAKVDVYDCYGVPAYSTPDNTNMWDIPCGAYIKTKYTTLPKRLVDFTRANLATDLVDVLASNTNSLILVLKTPADLPTVPAKDKPSIEPAVVKPAVVEPADPEFMVLERYGACQSNGAIHWRNKPISPWSAEQHRETSDYLLKRKFANLAQVSKLFDLVVEMLDRRDYSLRDLKDAHLESITMLLDSFYPGLTLAISKEHTATKNSDIVNQTLDYVKDMRADYKLKATAQFDDTPRFTTREPEFVRDIAKPHFGQPYITAYYTVDGDSFRLVKEE